MGYGRGGYRGGYQRTRTVAAAGNEPTAKQLAYLNTLIERAGRTQDEWRQSVGLVEANAWGGRLRTEMITRANVSRWIDELRGQAPQRRGRCEDAPCCGCCG